MSDRERWTDKVDKALRGKTVKLVRYLDGEEAQRMGWFYAVPVIEFTDGTLLWPASDDEGNEGGALFGQKPGGGDLRFPRVAAPRRPWHA